MEESLEFSQRRSSSQIRDLLFSLKIHVMGCDALLFLKLEQIQGAKNL